jgi:hypothetical protein
MRAYMHLGRQIWPRADPAVLPRKDLSLDPNYELPISSSLLTNGIQSPLYLSATTYLPETAE